MNTVDVSLQLSIISGKLADIVWQAQLGGGSEESDEQVMALYEEFKEVAGHFEEVVTDIKLTQLNEAKWLMRE